METNIQSGKRAPKRVTVKPKAIEADPFAAMVEETPVKKVAVKKTTAKVAKVVQAETEPVKKTVRKAPKSIVADPFAEVVEATSPVKKRVVKKTAAAVATEQKPTKTQKIAKKTSLDVTAEIAAADPKVEMSPVFKALATPVLPELIRENRARLQMQTPTRLYFYWSVKENPWAMLKNIFGDDLGSYALVLKLIDNKHGVEKIQQADAAGNFWFDVEPDGSYEAEIGFYAPNRPYFRVLHSNTVETPRRSPSPRAATDADWNITAHKFAEVLDVAGFSRDAFDVAMAGDDHAAAVQASHGALAGFVGRGHDLGGISAEDIRYALLALASGVKLADLRHKISPELFSILQANVDKIEASRAMSALTEHFDIDETEFTEEQFGPAVYGASLVNFPRTLKTRTVTAKGQFSPQYNPVSSHSYR